MRNQLKMTVLCLAMVLTLTVYAAADCRHRVVLTATSEGAAINAEGNAEAREQRGRERFKVEIQNLIVPDGTTFFAFADGQFAGTLTTTLGRDQLELDTEDGSLPPELRPVCNISTVEVTDANGTLILFGSF